MPYFLHQWRYKSDQIRAMVTHPQQRAEVVRLAIEAYGGTLHQFFFTFGTYDGLSISEFPDNETALACVMSIVGQGGLQMLETTVLITPEEGERSMRQAHTTVAPPLYSPPSK